MFEKYFEMKEEAEHNKKMYLWSQKNNRNFRKIHELYARIQMDLSIMVDTYDENQKDDN